MQPLEALADAIMQFEGWRPGSRSWRNRNPGNLRPYIPALQKTDGEGYRTFVHLSDGWDALLADLQAKLHGSHGLTPESTMLDLLNVYAPAGDSNNPTSYTKFVCAETTATLKRTIAPTTKLKEYQG